MSELTDRELEAAVAEAHLPTLLCALAHLTGDLGLLREEFRPSRRVTPLGFEPQGGMSPDTQVAARELCVTVLRDAFADGDPQPADLGPRLSSVVEFLVGSISGDYDRLLRHEVDPGGSIEQDDAWTMDEVAPDRDFKVAVIGAGMSGIVIGARLLAAGVPFTIFERAVDFGGVWLANDYPGCRLDTSNFSYTYSFRQKADWLHQYSGRDAVLDYLQSTATWLDLKSHTRFGHDVTAARYDDSNQTWRLEVVHEGRTEQLHFDAVVSAVGQLNTPKLPLIDGLDRYDGRAWHTADWPEDAELEGRAVGVVGVGASAFQAIQEIAPVAASLTIFQRTPPWVLPSAGYLDPIPEGQAWLLQRVPTYARWHRVQQFWSSVDSRRRYATIDPGWSEPGSVSADNAALREVLVANLEKHLADRPDLLAKSTPDYPPYGKRALRDGGRWFETLKRDNVRLVTEPVTNAVPDGLIDGSGELHDLDVIVFGTGFQASDFLRTVDVVGPGGRRLQDAWNGDARAYYGITVPGFPNLFCIYGPNTNLLANGSVVFFSECAANYVMSGLRLLLEKGARSMAIKPEVHDRYNAIIDDANSGMAYGQSGVSSWYKNAYGRVSGNWPLNSVEYWRGTREVQPDEYDLT